MQLAYICGKSTVENPTIFFNRLFMESSSYTQAQNILEAVKKLRSICRVLLWPSLHYTQMILRSTWTKVSKLPVTSWSSYSTTTGSDSDGVGGDVYADRGRHCKTNIS